ncbi:hypothetical protein B4168_1513 [Anoxybacillus flavithermus]|nr:hypothetical protein B4168_1513 [Anoxybacillus flavithermus]OAO84169.1 hypothetical protein GT23_3704 [Parageobacillus thermoglucosidasius]
MTAEILLSRLNSEKTMLFSIHFIQVYYMTNRIFYDKRRFDSVGPKPSGSETDAGSVMRWLKSS